MQQGIDDDGDDDGDDDDDDDDDDITLCITIRRRESGIEFDPS